MKRTVVAGVGLVSTLAGVLLRLSAYDLAWPATFSYGGPREDTIWYIREQAYQDLSLALIAFGLLVLLLIAANWLWPQER